MIHYICHGNCRGVSERPGVCQAADCPNFGETLENCECEDEQHEGVWRENSDQNNG